MDTFTGTCILELFRCFGGLRLCFDVFFPPVVSIFDGHTHRRVHEVFYVKRSRFECFNFDLKTFSIRQSFVLKERDGRQRRRTESL